MGAGWARGEQKGLVFLVFGGEGGGWESSTCSLRLNEMEIQLRLLQGALLCPRTTARYEEFYSAED